MATLMAPRVNGHTVEGREHKESHWNEYMHSPNLRVPLCLELLELSGADHKAMQNDLNCDGQKLGS